MQGAQPVNRELFNEEEGEEEKKELVWRERKMQAVFGTDTSPLFGWLQVEGWEYRQADRARSVGDT